MPMIQLPVQAPPKLAEALGYEGTQRYVGFFWTPAGDEFCYDDGTVMTTNGVWYAWQTFREHELVMAHLAPFNFGNSDEDATHWLIVDREQNTLHVAPVKEADAFLAQHAPQLPQVNFSREDWDKVIKDWSEQWRQIPAPTMEQIQARMNEEVHRIEEMVAWLDQALAKAPRTTCPECGLSLIADGRPCLHFDFGTQRFLAGVKP